MGLPAILETSEDFSGGWADGSMLEIRTKFKPLRDLKLPIGRTDKLTARPGNHLRASGRRLSLDS
jgi:hypothetical protein